MKNKLVRFDKMTQEMLAEMAEAAGTSEAEIMRYAVLSLYAIRMHVGCGSAFEDVIRDIKEGHVKIRTS